MIGCSENSGCALIFDLCVGPITKLHLKSNAWLYYDQDLHHSLPPASSRLFQASLYSSASSSSPAQVFFFNMKSYFVSINLRKHCTVAYCSQEVYKYFVLPWYFVDAIYSFMEIILPLMSQPTTQSIFPTFSFRRLILLLSYTFAENCYFLRKITLLTMANS